MATPPVPATLRIVRKLLSTPRLEGSTDEHSGCLGRLGSPDVRQVVSGLVVTGLVLGVAGLLELECGVVDTDGEVVGDAGLQLVEQSRDVPVVEALVVDDDVGAEDRESSGDLGGV